MIQSFIEINISALESDKLHGKIHQWYKMSIAKILLEITIEILEVISQLLQFHAFEREQETLRCFDGKKHRRSDF